MERKFQQRNKRKEEQKFQKQKNVIIKKSSLDLVQNKMEMREDGVAELEARLIQIIPCE